MIKIALLSGGTSGEREVSIKTGHQIFNALDKNKYKVFKYDPKTDLEKFTKDAFSKKFDLIFPALHGPFGEDGKLQGLFDMINIPYLFSGCLASALAMDKIKSKIIASNAGLNVIPGISLSIYKPFNIDDILNKINLPVIVKPAELGSSVGMSLVRKKDDLKIAINTAFKHGHNVLIEKFIKGRELTVPIISNNGSLEAMPIIEIIPVISEWFDFKAKYEVGGSKEVCPADINETIKINIENFAKTIFYEIGCKTLARVDFILSNDDNKLYFLEINTIPGMTETSLVPLSAKIKGINFNEFLDKIIFNTLNASNRNK